MNRRSLNGTKEKFLEGLARRKTTKLRTMYLVQVVNGDRQKYNKNCQKKLDDPED